jgi:hypothetical protein
MPFFNFNGTIPQATDNPSDSQPLILQNFGSTQGIENVDHFGFNNNNGGLHRQVTFADVATPLAQVDPSSVLFTKNDTAGHPQLFFSNSQNTGQYIIGIVNNASGCVPLFGGLILQWLYTPTSAAGTPFTFPIPFPNLVFAVTMGGVAAGAQAFALSGITLLGGTAYNSVGGGAQNAYIIAIGK